MADRTGLARKLEFAHDAPVSEPPDAADLSIGDTGDGRMLDDHAVLDILELNDKFDLAATFIPPGGVANRVMLREALSRLKRDAEGTTSQHRNKPKATRISWGQRLSSWFKRA
jgi:hypothetical protein